MSNARLVTAFSETFLNDEELKYLLFKYGIFKENYNSLTENDKKIYLNRLILQYNEDNEKSLLKKLAKNDSNVKKILDMAYPVYLEGRSKTSLDLALNSAYIKDIFDNWISNQKDNYEKLNIGYIMKNDFVFSNFMEFSYSNWNVNLIENINNFLKIHNTDIVNNLYIVNTDALTSSMPSGTHWMAIYNTVESYKNLIHKIPKMALKKEKDILNYLKKNYKGKVSDLIINDIKIFDKNEWPDNIFDYNEKFTLFDIWLTLKKYINSEISSLKSPLYDYYGSIEYFDPLGDPIIKKSTNRPSVELKIKQNIISQCKLFSKNNMLVLPIDWKTKQQNDSFCCGYHSLAFLYNRIFCDTYPKKINHLNKEEVEKRLKRLFDFNPKLEKCFDLALSHKEMDIENPKVQEIYGKGKSMFEYIISFKAPFEKKQKLSLESLNEYLKIPITSLKKIESIGKDLTYTYEIKSKVCFVSIENHISYVYFNEVYDSENGIYINGKKMLEKYGNNLLTCFIIALIRPKLNSSEMIFQILSKFDDELEKKILKYYFN